MSKQQTFVLVYQTLVNKLFLGVICRELERKGLTIIGIKYMSVNSDFAKLHIQRPGRVNQEVSFNQDWIEYLTECPLVILLLEGVNAVKLARQVTTTQWSLEWRQRHRYIGGNSYSSLTAENAKEDIEMWFNDDHDDEWSEKCLEKDLVYVFRDKVLGDEEGRAPFCYEYVGYECYEDLYYQDSQVFILIRPAAVRHRLVGQIINAFERNCSGQLRGLKRVNMKELPEGIACSGDSSSSETAVDVDDDGSSYGVAMVFERLRIDRKIILTEKGGNHCFFDPKKFTLEIDSNLIHISKPGQDAWELIKRCFHFGFVIRPATNCIAILEASLTGLSSCSVAELGRDYI